MSLPGRIRRFFLRGREVTPEGSPPKTAPGREIMVTNSEVNYFGLASVLIDLHGAGAREEAATLVREALQEDDPEAVADWLAVECAIALLTGDSAATRS